MSHGQNRAPDDARLTMQTIDPGRQNSTPLTVSNWPDNFGDNPYLPLYYGALGKYGIALGPAARIEDSFLRENAGVLAAVHIQYVPEQIWRTRGTSWRQRLRGLLGFWKYLRLARSLGIRIIWTVHDVEHHEGSGWLDELGYRLLARKADLCIVHDDWAREQLLRRFHGDPERACVMEIGNYDGVFPPPASREDTLAALGIDPQRRVLFCQGLVRPYKGYQLAIEAVRQLGSPYHLIVCGRAPDPDFEQTLTRQASDLPNVTLLLKWQSDQVLSNLFNACDCFVLPYLKITGSSSLLTAATLGRGSVASDLPYFRRAANQEPDAVVLFKPGSPDALARAITTFFDQPVERRHAAARRLAEGVPWVKVVQPVVEWFRRLPVPTRTG